MCGWTLQCQCFKGKWKLKMCLMWVLRLGRNDCSQFSSKTNDSRTSRVPRSLCLDILLRNLQVSSCTTLLARDAAAKDGWCLASDDVTVDVSLWCHHFQPKLFVWYPVSHNTGCAYSVYIWKQFLFLPTLNWKLQQRLFFMNDKPFLIIMFYFSFHNRWLLSNSIVSTAVC